MDDQREINEKNKIFLEKFKFLEINYNKEIKALNVSLNRPKQLNAINYELFEEISDLFLNVYELSKTYDIRSIILKGSGKCFSAGLDLKSKVATDIVSFKSNTDIDIGRKSFHIYFAIKKLQDCLLKIEQCHVPVICLIHGVCLGAGISILSFCDIVFAEKKATFSIKEIDIGLVADIGILQRIQKIIGNSNVAKLWAYTGRHFTAEEAYRHGLVQDVSDNYKNLIIKGENLAKEIASKSPLIVWGIKKVLNFSRENSLEASLEHIRVMNQGLIQGDELDTSISAFLTKTKPNYPKL